MAVAGALGDAPSPSMNAPTALASAMIEASSIATSTSWALSRSSR